MKDNVIVRFALSWVESPMTGALPDPSWCSAGISMAYLSDCGGLVAAVTFNAVLVQSAGVFVVVEHLWYSREGGQQLQRKPDSSCKGSQIVVTKEARQQLQSRTAEVFDLGLAPRSTLAA
jgi:hypothetical protein